MIEKSQCSRLVLRQIPSDCVALSQTGTEANGCKALLSPVFIMILLPSSFIKDRVLVAKALKVLIATGTKQYACACMAYLESFSPQQQMQLYQLYL